jgi:molybdopterin converting factor small subunit
LKVTVRAFGPVMEVIGRKREMELPADSTLRDLAARLEDEAKTRLGKAPRIMNSNLTILVNGMNIEALKDRGLREGDHVDILSPFVGG